MGSCLSWFQDCDRNTRYYGLGINEVPLTMGPHNVPAAELCPHCNGVVRNARQIWLDELEEEVLNARCIGRIVDAENKKQKTTQKSKDSGGDLLKIKRKGQKSVTLHNGIRLKPKIIYKSDLGRISGVGGDGDSELVQSNDLKI